MRISDTEIKKIISGPSTAIVDAIVETGVEHVRLENQKLVEAVSAEVLAMTDREEMIEEIRAQIASGQYNPSGEEIVDAMLRRAIADNFR